jgi:Uma2 family endonuclease
MSTAEQVERAMGSLVLFDISPDQYSGILEAMAEHRFRHTYDSGLLEIFGETSAKNAAAGPGGLRPPVRKGDERAITLYDLSPEQYRRLLAALGDRRLRHSYNHGTLEIMSPSQTHEWENRFLDKLLSFLAEAIGVEILSLGSWTLKPRDFEKGVEPDSCYYIANESKVRFKKELDLDKDPPPDLAIEIDVSHSSLPRQPIYHAIGVPELWRYSGATMRFFQLAAGGYQPIDRSVAFPFLPPERLEELLDSRYEKTEMQLLKEFVAWVRENANE